MRAHSASERSVWYVFLMHGRVPNYHYQTSPFRTVSPRTPVNKGEKKEKSRSSQGNSQVDMGKGEVTPLQMDEGCAKRKPRPVTYGDRLRVSRSSSRACLRSSRSSRLTCWRSSCSSCLTSSRSSCSSWRSWSRSFSQSCSPSSSRFLPTLTFSLVDSLPLRIIMGTLIGFPRIPMPEALFPRMSLLGNLVNRG